MTTETCEPSIRVIRPLPDALIPPETISIKLEMHARNSLTAILLRITHYLSMSGCLPIAVSIFKAEERLFSDTDVSVRGCVEKSVCWKKSGFTL